jgi:large subunit ribosomal protein L22
MLSGDKLSSVSKRQGVGRGELAAALVRAGRSAAVARAAVGNWMRGKLTPAPSGKDIEALARALNVERQDLEVWQASHRYCPMTAQKARLVTDLIRGRSVQDALDVLRFANKRAAVTVDKVVRSAMANADDQEADVERLIVREAWVDEGGIRVGTRRWRPKDRGRAHSWLRKACHINVRLDLE